MHPPAPLEEQVVILQLLQEPLLQEQVVHPPAPLEEHVVILQLLRGPLEEQVVHPAMQTLLELEETEQQQ